MPLSLQELRGQHELAARRSLAEALEQPSAERERLRLEEERKRARAAEQQAAAERRQQGGWPQSGKLRGRSRA